MSKNEIREIRRSLRMSQAALSKRSGIERTRLSFAENGHVDLTNEECEAVKTAFLEELFEQGYMHEAAREHCLSVI